MMNSWSAADNRWPATLLPFLREVYAWREELLARHGDVVIEANTHPFPGMTLGALLTLWRRSPWHAGPCPRCGGAGVGLSACGLGDRGSVQGVCLGCGGGLIRHTPVPAQQLANAVLADTPWRLAQRHAWGWALAVQR